MRRKLRTPNSKHDLLTDFVNMVDTIHIEILLDHMPPTKGNKTTIDAETGEILFDSGYLENFRVKKTQRGIRLEGSLGRLLYGHNVRTLSHWEVLYALNKLSQLIGEDVGKGVIRRLDIQGTFTTIYPPTSYFRYLGSKVQCQRKPDYKYSLYYKNHSKEVIIYDKIRQMKEKRTPIPDFLNGKNLLRYESRYFNNRLKQFSKELGLDKLTVENFIEPDIYTFFLGQWKQDYQEIFKEEKPIIDLTKIKKKRDLIEQLAHFGIETLGGEGQLVQLIEESRPYSVGIRSEYISRRKREIKEIASLQGFTKEHKVIEEINEKVEKAFKQEVNNFLIDQYEIYGEFNEDLSDKSLYGYVTT